MTEAALRAGSAGARAGLFIGAHGWLFAPRAANQVRVRGGGGGAESRRGARTSIRHDEAISGDELALASTDCRPAISSFTYSSAASSAAPSSPSSSGLRVSHAPAPNPSSMRKRCSGTARLRLRNTPDPASPGQAPRNRGPRRGARGRQCHLPPDRDGYRHQKPRTVTDRRHVSRHGFAKCVRASARASQRAERLAGWWLVALVACHVYKLPLHY